MIVDFASLFEYGSGYTSISRVNSLEKIKLLTFPTMEMEADLNNEFVYQKCSTSSQKWLTPALRNK